VGRKSKLTDAQWAEVERRLLAGEKRDHLAREFKVSGPAITQRCGKRLVTVKAVANQLVSAEVSLRKLPIADQVQALNLADELRSISTHLAGAARYGAATAHRLAGIANGKVAEVDDAAPLTAEGVEALKGVAVLTKLANDSAVIGLNLLAANKDSAKRAEIAEVPDGLGHFYGEGASLP